MKILYIALLILISIFFILFFISKHEKFQNQNYLYPIKGLQPICAEEDLLPSYMPKACYVNNVLNSYANCKCEDINGNCKLCYPTINKTSNNSNVIYNANIS